MEVIRLDMEEIFASQYQRFNHYPLGFITLKNASDQVIDEFIVETYAQDFMDNPRASLPRKNIRPQEKFDIQLFGGFNQKVLSISEDQTMNLRIRFIFKSGGKIFKRDLEQPVNLFQKNAFIWDRPSRLGVFITSKEETVKTFARNSINQSPLPLLENLEPPLVYALALFTALKEYGIRYIPDPQTPFREFYQNKKKTDYIQFPHEVLRHKSGDCDDLSVLMASLLENVGVKTAFAVTENHIFILFDTGIPLFQKENLILPRELLFAHKGTFWVPLETTLLDKTFLDSWKKGVSNLQESQNGENSFLEILETHQMWKEYIPLNISNIQSLQFQPDKLRLLDSLSVQGNIMAQAILEMKQKTLENEMKGPLLFNKLGILHASFGFYQKAKTHFENALNLDNKYLPVLFNLGNTYFLEKNYERALFYYLQFQKQKPDDQDILNAIKNLIEESRDPELAKRFPAELKLRKNDESISKEFSPGAETKAEKNLPPRVKWIAK